MIKQTPQRPDGQQRSSRERIVSVKQIAHELEIKASVVRLMLRARYRDHPHNTPWRWTESQARDVRKYLTKVLGRDR